MKQMLPFNRKEKYWTSCVLPSIICGENNFSDLKVFLNLIKVPKRFIKDKYEDSEIDFYTEYCLRDSALDWNISEKLSGETPDLVMLIENSDEQFLIFLEAKMYDKVTSNKMRIQLNNQKKIAHIIMKNLEIKKENFMHIILFLQGPCDFSPLKDEIVINWTEICDSYGMKSNNYFYKKLKEACGRTNLMSKGAESYGENCTERVNFRKIVNYFNANGDFYVGRDGNIDQVEDDCITGRVKSFPYEINTHLNPSIDKAPGITGRNWFAASDFVNMLRKHNIIT